MNDIGLFEATIPVFRYFLYRIESMLLELPEEGDALLQRKLVPAVLLLASNLRSHKDSSCGQFFPCWGKMDRT